MLRLLVTSIPGQACLHEYVEEQKQRHTPRRRSLGAMARFGTIGGDRRRLEVNLTFPDLGLQVCVFVRFFQTRTGKRFSIQQVDYVLKKLAGQANATLPAKEHIDAHPHITTELWFQSTGRKRCPTPFLLPCWYHHRSIHGTSWPRTRQRSTAAS